VYTESTEIKKNFINISCLGSGPEYWKILSVLCKQIRSVLMAFKTFAGDYPINFEQIILKSDEEFSSFEEEFEEAPEELPPKASLFFICQKVT
jgi:hypothetical protein